MACSSSATLRRILADELADHADARRTGDVAGAWRALERAHIVSQPFLGQHMRVHMIMLGFAFWLRQPREVVGQIARLALAPLGAVMGRIPWGNTGRSDVSAFQFMPVPPDLEIKMSDKAKR